MVRFLSAALLLSAVSRPRRPRSPRSNSPPPSSSLPSPRCAAPRSARSREHRPSNLEHGLGPGALRRDASSLRSDLRFLQSRLRRYQRPPNGRPDADRPCAGTSSASYANSTS